MIGDRGRQLTAPLTHPMHAQQPGPGTLIRRPVRRTPTRHPPSFANLDTHVQTLHNRVHFLRSENA